MASIILHRDGKSTRHELTDAPFEISRDSKADICLNDRTVSRRHATIFREKGVWHLKDPESTGGTFINLIKVSCEQPVILRHGDHIKIGPFKLIFENDEEFSVGQQKESSPGFPSPDDGSGISASSSGFGSVSIRPEEKLNGILKINESLAGNVDFRAICPRVLNTLFDIFPQADRGVIQLLQDDRRSPVTVAEQHRNPNDRDPVKPSRTVLDLVLQTNREVLWPKPDALDDSRLAGAHSIHYKTIQSTMCVPMWGLDGKPFGVISLDSQNPNKRFSTGDLQILLAVASQASHTYENARLLTASVLAKQKQDDEMELSAQVQRALIPATLPQPPGYQFYGSYDAAHAVGGDYFDCFEIADGRICVSFGDVAGKGVPAALIMTRLSGIVRSTMHFTDDVGFAMCQINNLMCTNMVDGLFVTYLLGIIDPKSHTFTFANAGHLPPEVRSPSAELSGPGIENSGFPIGLFETSAFATSTISLAAGTSVILRTDGVDEAMSVGEEFYGIDRFRAVLRSHLADPAAIGRALLTDVKAFMAGYTQHDDITIMSFGRLA